MNDPLAEAVEQARENIDAAAYRLDGISPSAPKIELYWAMRDDFESAIRAQERARYQALVDAARDVEGVISRTCYCDEGYRNRELLDPQCQYHQVSPEIDVLRELLQKAVTE